MSVKPRPSVAPTPTRKRCVALSAFCAVAMFAYMARRSLSNGLMAAFMSIGGAAGGALTGLVSRQAAGDGIPEPAAR